MKKKEGFNGQRAIVLPDSIIRYMDNSPLTQGCYPTDIGYYPSAQNHYRERPNGIPQYVLLYCTNGGGWYEINKQHKPLQANQYVILPPNIPHCYGADEKNPWTLYWIHFKGKNAEYLIESPEHFPKDIQPGDSSRINYRNQLFEQIYHCLDMGYSPEYLCYASICLQYYLSSLRYINIFREAVDSAPKNKNLTTSIIHYMKENLEKQLKIEDIAETFHISSTSLYQQFKAATQYSPINYMNHLRIQEACQYLDFTDMKISQICHRIGIEDPYYFSRLFSKIMNISPKEYRKREKG